jgi:RNA polymerase sigma-70 factor (ECF subfamily)
LPRQEPEIAPAGEVDPSTRRSSFDGLYADHFPFVWRCLRGLGVPDAALDDATQDVFLAVHRQLPAFRGESAVRTWLFGIVRNVASNHRRSGKRKGGHAPLDEDLPSTGPGPADKIEEIQAADFVRAFVATLDEGRRELFVMVLLEEISVPEAAAALGIPLNTAYTRVRRMRVAFQQALARREGKS